MAQPNYYEILGVASDASVEEITRAYREKTAVFNPETITSDPSAREHFKWLNLAFQVLNDVPSRKDYDAKSAPLPCASPTLDIDELWQSASRTYFQQTERFTPAVDGMRVGRPLVLDGNLLVIGMEPGKAALAGYLTAALAYNQIRKILCELCGRSLEFRVIIATSAEEWSDIKEGEEKMRRKRYGPSEAERAAQTAAASVTPAAKTASVTSIAAVGAMGSEEVEEVWEGVLDNVVRAWSAMENRSFPQTRARFVQEQLQQLARAEGTSRASGVQEEISQRFLSRAIERISHYTGIESGVIGLEYLRYRARLLGGM